MCRPLAVPITALFWTDSSDVVPEEKSAENQEVANSVITFFCVYNRHCSVPVDALFTVSTEGTKLQKLSYSWLLPFLQVPEVCFYSVRDLLWPPPLFSTQPDKATPATKDNTQVSTSLALAYCCFNLFSYLIPGEWKLINVLATQSISSCALLTKTLARFTGFTYYCLQCYGCDTFCLHTYLQGEMLKTVNMQKQR